MNSLLMKMTTMMAMIEIGRVSGLSTTVVALGEVRSRRVPVALVVLTMRGEDGVEADGRVPALLAIIPCGLDTCAISIDASRVLFRRLSGEAEAWLRFTARVPGEAVR